LTSVPTPEKPRVGLLATHPVQYYVPWYRLLAQELNLKVFYSHRQTAEGQARAGFGIAFVWDVPLLEGYSHRFLSNRARKPNVSSFFGCDTPEITRIVRHGGFDAFIVHGWATLSFWQAIMACRRSGTPVLVRGDSQLLSPRRRLVRVAKWPFYRLFIPRFDAYLVVGKRARDYYAHYGAKAGRMFFSPHAVDNDFFQVRSDALRAERGRLRTAWGIPDAATVFLFAGKLTDGKRPSDFVRAVGQAAQTRPGTWGLVVGDGQLRPSLEAQVRDADWPVRFAGFLNQTEMPRAYAASDALVLPSASSETWGLVVNEAMASGLPAIVSDQVGCGPDLVLPGETGEVFACGAVAELASILVRLAGAPSVLSKLGAQAQRLVQRYSLSEAVKGTVAAVECVIGERARCKDALSRSV
jgi:glycosyltransferase involved in cell wall biosynthesis